MFVAIDRTSKFAFARLEEMVNRMMATAERSNSTVHDPHVRSALPTERYQDRLTKPNYPWTNGYVERMYRTHKEAMVKRYHYCGRGQLRAHLQTFLDAYNFAKRIKTLKGLTPYEYICKLWTEQSHRFRLDSIHPMSGLNA
jgi:transposase InsO family protein